MSTKISSLRFQECVDRALRSRSRPYTSFAGFSNAILEYVFRLPREERGFIEAIIYSEAVSVDGHVSDRIARLDVLHCGYKLFFYVWAEANNKDVLHEWKVVGRSVLINDRIRMPDYEKEMIWFE